MLLFIDLTGITAIEEQAFQYISCYCLSVSLNPVTKVTTISIHLMLLFILEQIETNIKYLKFQYISCYCLSNQYNQMFPQQEISIHLMLLFINLSLFLFLSNPNFNTSHVTVYPGTSGNYVEYAVFQYISCYCLSCWHFPNAINCFNFNTSHVTVYRNQLFFETFFVCISIHLMLLFIIF